MTPLVLREDHDGLATLTLNRPDKLNALTVAMFQQLQEHVLQIASETERVVPTVTCPPRARSARSGGPGCSPRSWRSSR